MQLDNNLQYVVEICETFDEPIPYKDWSIIPIPLTKYFDFAQCSTILDIDKNAIGDVEIISMSYLKFLLSVAAREDTTILYKLAVVLNLCLGFDGEVGINIDEKQRYSLILKYKDGTQNVMSSRDFDTIRYLILTQNILNYKDTSNLDAAMKKDLESYYAIKNKGIDAPTLAKRLAIVQSHTGISKSELCKMTIRSFDILFDTVVEEVDYEVNKPIELNGNVKVDKPTEHWVWKKSKGLFSDAFVSYDGLEQKINTANGK